MEPLTAITSIKGAIDIVKNLSGLIPKQKKPGELSDIVLDLQGKLAGSLAEISDLIQDNHNLKDEIRNLNGKIEELKEKLETKENLIFKDNKYWIAKDASHEDGPFCTVCWDEYKNLNRLHFGDGYSDYCPVCDLKRRLPK